jgi:chemotaxis protein CheZ
MNSATLPERESLHADEKAATKAKLGAITRELHDALRALGAAPELQRVVREIPDTRSRLSHVGEMTEKAAHRVLNLVDEAMPKVTELRQQASLVTLLINQQTLAPDLDSGGMASLMAQCGTFAQNSFDFATQQQQTLSDIMLTQDFQDLSGQVIKKVIDMITRTEDQLVQLLIDHGDVEVPELAAETPLLGPQTPENALAQDDVDDLLASMGF